MQSIKAEKTWQWKVAGHIESKQHKEAESVQTLKPQGFTS